MTELDRVAFRIDNQSVAIEVNGRPLVELVGEVLEGAARCGIAEWVASQPLHRLGDPRREVVGKAGLVPRFGLRLPLVVEDVLEALAKLREGVAQVDAVEGTFDV